MHAPSVGEGLQARPVMHALRAAHPSWQFAYTYFSPSAQAFAPSIGAEICDYLPFDRAADADRLLDALRPSALVFAKLDVWPVLVARAQAKHVPVALISGTLAEQSGRLGWWSQQLVRDAYAALNAVGAIDASHADRLQSLGVSASSIAVTGDTRFDQVAARAAAVDHNAPLLTALTSPRATVVAGSTWPADEVVLLPAWERTVAAAAAQSTDRQARPRLIIAPHEPTASHCEPIVQWATTQGLSLARLSEISATPTDADVILVDRVGVLGDLYALATVAFVGGGFHRAGLHSVIEPAAFGVPVVFGPRHQASREAQVLLDVGGASAVTDSTALTAQFTRWLNDHQARAHASRAARDAVERETGATARSVALISALIADEG